MKGTLGKYGLKPNLITWSDMSSFLKAFQIHTYIPAKNSFLFQKKIKEIKIPQNREG